MAETPPRRPVIGRWDPLTVGVDIGGTKVLAGVVDSSGRVLERQRRLTPGTSVRDVEDTIVDLVQGFGRTHDRRYTTHLRDLIISGRAQPSQVITHHESL